MRITTGTSQQARWSEMIDGLTRRDGTVHDAVAPWGSFQAEATRRDPFSWPDGNLPGAI
jgi:hypothetical protein